MDKNKIRNYQIFSTIFTFIVGTLLHFTYKLSGENQLAAIFSSVNESVWEHLKLLFFPMLITTIIGCYYIGKNIPNFLCAKTIGIIVSMVFMIIFFYTYSGVIGNNIPIIDISLFYVATILGEFISYILIINKFNCNNKLFIIVLIIILISFIIFTFNAPNFGIFAVPLTRKF